MPIPLPKHQTPARSFLRDVRPVSVRITEIMETPATVAMAGFSVAGFLIGGWHLIAANIDWLAVLAVLYFRWANKRPFHLPFMIPKHADMVDPRNPKPGSTKPGWSDGILYLGNTSDKDNPDFGQEVWFTNTDIRTHILYLGTTGSGKTEGLKGLVTNALSWGSGYVYIDGKADTDLWASLYATARRFGRDDDLLVLNYMTGNSDAGSTSNTMNPFSNGSSSYLSNMIVNFMPDAGGDNAMWKERAVALMFALMPALVWQRDHQGVLLDIGVVRDNIELRPIIRLSRDPNLPERVTHALQGYLNTLPGYVDAAFDDEGNERPPSPDQPMYDLQVARQQHGYLSMQFTRALQMMADEYGYIFKAQLADIDVLDVVLNRRIMITLIPALEKAGPEAANLGKIVAATLKGMMGMTLGNAVEGSWEMAIGSKQTRAASSFMAVFDEVGYYTAQGMAVMAAQARSLGFSLVFASQDLPSMEKSIKQEAKSIVGNCNIKLFGRLEDPTDTKDFLTKHSGVFWALESKGSSAPTNTVSSLFMSTPFYDDRGVGGPVARQRIDYDHIREQREGEVHMFYGDWIARARMFYVDSERAKALRVHHLLAVPSTTNSTAQRERAGHELASRLKDENWTALAASNPAAASPEIGAIATTMATAESAKRGMLEGAAMAVAAVAALPAAKPKTEAAVPAASAPRAGQQQGRPALEQQAPLVAMPDISPAEKAQARASLPPLYEGDQYAIGDLEQAPQSAQAAQAAPATGNGTSSAAPGGYTPSDADFAVVTSPGGMEEEPPDVMAVQLPPELAALIEQSAQKLNRGLGGTGERQQ